MQDRALPPAIVDVIAEAQRVQERAEAAQIAVDASESLLTLQASVDTTNMLLTALIGCVLALGAVNALLGWLHGR